MTRDAALAQSGAFNEFISGTNRIVQSSMDRINPSNATLKIIKNIKKKEVIIMPFDKTKRMVALNPDDYDQLLVNS